MKNKIKHLLSSTQHLSVHGKADEYISGVSTNSKNISNNDIFIAIRGIHTDSHNFIEEAISKGATVVVGEANPSKVWVDKATYIKVINSRKAYAQLSVSLYNFPADKLKLVGVTGTDGKTTTSNILWWILNKSGIKTGLVSTVGAKIGTRTIDTGAHVTSPEPLELHKLLKKMVDAKCKIAVLEVSSHGLDQHRFEGLRFDVGLLTNITPEHLDYHKTFKHYKKTKLNFLRNSGIQIKNGSDKLPNKIQNIINKKFPEKYNQENASLAVQAAMRLSVSQTKIVKALTTFPGVKGRMEKVPNKKGIHIYIDYAHTTNGLKRAIKETRKKIKKNEKLIVITGAEGERDKQKRPKMGAVAAELADYTVFTNVDPRSEKPETIIQDMVKGVKKGKRNHFLIVDRKKAIKYVINSLAKKGDTILVCGKGHENSMTFNETSVPWSDKKIIIGALK